eukprot:COSAG02_NODE_13073_length_1449_cov_1.525926_2_plen_164_part_00
MYCSVGSATLHISLLASPSSISRSWITQSRELSQMYFTSDGFNIHRREIPPVAVNGCSGSLYTPVRHSLSASDTRNKSWPGGTSMFLSREDGGGRTALALQLPVRSKPRENSAEEELRARVSCIAVRWRWRAAASSTAGSSISENAGRPVPISLRTAQCSSAA